DGRGEGKESGRTGVSPGCRGSARLAFGRAGAAPGISTGENSRTYYRTGTGDYVSCSLARRSGKSACESRVPHSDEQRDRAVQRWAAFSSHGQLEHPQVSRL